MLEDYTKMTPAEAVAKGQALADSHQSRSLESRKNLYLCHQCGRGFVTIDAACGVTPFSTGCERCSGTVTSAFYRVDTLLQGIPPAKEWYRPKPDDPKLASPFVREHVARGGLLLRDALGTTATPNQ